MASSSGYWMSENTLSDKFPNGLRVLLVDDDQTCLTILEKMLRSCLYQVTKCNRAEAALALLRERKNDFDIVMSDVHMPDMDGFKLLECVGLEMDLPVIMMSADDSKSVVMKGISHGACDYLIKPIRIEVIRTLWKHVFIKWKSEQKERPRRDGDDGVKNVQGQQKSDEDADLSSSVNEGDWRNSKKRKDEEDGDDREEKDDMPTSKKPRVVWSGELHQQFVDAVTQIGIDKAVPKKILELMNVPGITRENVASHLQKFRLYLKKMNEPTPQQHQPGYRNPLVSPTGPYGSSLPSLNMLDRQYHHPFTGQFQSQSLSSSQAEAFRRSRSGLMPGYDPRTIPILRQNVGGGAFSGGVNMQGSQMNGEYGGTQLHQILNIRNDYVPMPLSATMARNWVADNSRGGLYGSASQPSSTVHFPVQQNPNSNIAGIASNRAHQDVKFSVDRSRGFNSSYSTTAEPMDQNVAHALDTGKIALDVQQPYSGEQELPIPLLCDSSTMANADQSSQNPIDFTQEDLNHFFQEAGIETGGENEYDFPHYSMDGIAE